MKKSRSLFVLLCLCVLAMADAVKGTDKVRLKLRFAVQQIYRRPFSAEKNMKIYLLVTLIAALLTAVHMTAAPEANSTTLPQ